MTDVIRNYYYKSGAYSLHYDMLDEILGLVGVDHISIQEENGLPEY